MVRKPTTLYANIAMSLANISLHKPFLTNDLFGGSKVPKIN
jgi:hypothetical protein